jgi:hypothetical protein
LEVQYLHAIENLSLCVRLELQYLHVFQTSFIVCKSKTIILAYNTCPRLCGELQYPHM